MVRRSKYNDGVFHFNFRVSVCARARARAQACARVCSYWCARGRGALLLLQCTDAEISLHS
jgi:hypothetical protein